MSTEGEVEYAAAVAAAAFAISMFESASRYEEPRDTAGTEPSLDRIISQKETTTHIGKLDNEPESSSEKTKAEPPSEADTSKPPSDDGNGVPEKIIHPVPPKRRRPMIILSSNDFDEIESMEPIMDTPKPRSPPPPPPPPAVPSTRRRATFALNSKDFEEMERIKPRFDIQKPSIPPPPIPPPPIPPPLSQTFPPPIEAPEPRFQESEADAWEKDQLEKIKKRYEELNKTILEWENKRKKKAKSKLDKTEGDPGKKRAKALQGYQADIDMIRQITEGAKNQAKEKRRNEEWKVREKADKYRATGEPPATCLCF